MGISNDAVDHFAHSVILAVALAGAPFDRGGGSDRRSSTQLLADQRSDLGSEELDRAHRLCMINMGDVHLETINLHQLVQPDDLGSHSLGSPKNSAPSGPIRSSTAASDIGGQPRSRPILAKVWR